MYKTTTLKISRYPNYSRLCVSTDPIHWKKIPTPPWDQTNAAFSSMNSKKQALNRVETGPGQSSNAAN